MGIFDKTFRKIENNINGAKGERQVSSTLNPLFKKSKHYQIDNLMLLDDNLKTHQIDHIEIRPNGIFCIETKNYTGAIYGYENQQQWLQCVGNEKKYFTNPLKQNHAHIYHVKQALFNLLDKEYDVHSLVVFTQNNVKNLNIKNVINLEDLKNYLDNFNDGNHFDDEEMCEIYGTLLLANNKISTKQHVKIIKQTQDELKAGICPRCGGDLILRQSEHGKFFACNQYPKCQFVLKNTNKVNK